MLGESGRVLQREPHDLDVATAGTLRCERNGGVGLGGWNQLGSERLELLDDGAEVGPGFGGLQLVDTHVEHEASGFSASGHGAELRRNCRSGSDRLSCGSGKRLGLGEINGCE